VIRDRIQSITAPDRLDILDRIIAGAKRDGINLEDPENVRQLRDEIKTFLFAGHETSSIMLTWALYELTQNPDVATKLREEANKIFPLDRNVLTESHTVEQLSSLQYSLAVLKEALRKWPPVPLVTRQCSCDASSLSEDKSSTDGRLCLEVPEEGLRVELESGSRVAVLIYALHHNEKIWKDPSNFRPERFLSNSNNVILQLQLHSFFFFSFLFFSFFDA
jgi:cytochrome P450/NADPH-cytochrome P450 reductase